MFYFYFPANVSVCVWERDCLIGFYILQDVRTQTHWVSIYMDFTYGGDSLAAVSVLAVFDFQLVQRGVWSILSSQPAVCILINAMFAQSVPHLIMTLKWLSAAAQRDLDTLR